MNRNRAILLLQDLLKATIAVALVASLVAVIVAVPLRDQPRLEAQRIEWTQLLVSLELFKYKTQQAREAEHLRGKCSALVSYYCDHQDYTDDFDTAVCYFEELQRMCTPCCQ